MSDDNEYFTIVFKGNLQDFMGNPLKTETPFGIPFAAGFGDAFARINELEERIEEMEIDWHDRVESDLST